MKTLKIILSIMAAVMAAACAKDNGKDSDSAKEVAGTYHGWTSARFQYSSEPMMTDGESVSVSEDAEGTVTVNYTSNTWGAFTVTARVSGSDGIYAITGSGSTLMGMSEESRKEYECSMTGTVNKTDDKAGFVFDVPSVMGGLTIEFNTGDMPENSGAETI